MSSLESFVPVEAEDQFPIHNLPFGCAEFPGSPGPVVCTRIGNQCVNLKELSDFFTGPHLSATKVFEQSSLNGFMSLGTPARVEARQTLQRLLSTQEGALRDNPALLSRVLVPVDSVKMSLPAHTPNFTDFFACKHHIERSTKIFLQQKFGWWVGSTIYGLGLYPHNGYQLPLAYNGRASSIIPGGVPVHRPRGQFPLPGSKVATYQPTLELDFELEVGVFISQGSELGAPVSVQDAKNHIFGMVLLNDWSARDVQKYECVPLGPFCSKNFATSISPWIVTLEALEPFLCQADAQCPPPPPHLFDSHNESTYDIRLSASLASKEMRERTSDPALVSKCNMRDLYWNVSQQIAQLTASGTMLQTGDLVGTGTISGADLEGAGCLLERTQGGTRPLLLPSGEKRGFLEDFDEVSLSGFCQGDGFRVGFGELTGLVLPAQ